MATVQLTLEQVNKSKVFVPKIEALSFKEPAYYLEPFREKFAGMQIDWTFKGEVGSQNKDKDEEFENGNGEMNIAYSSIIAQAKLPSEFEYTVQDARFNKLFTEIGLVYNFDGQKPQMRVYRGSKVFVCSNGVIFGAENIMTIPMISGKSGLSDIYDKTTKYIDTALDMVKRYERTIEGMTNKIYKGREINEKFGEMVRVGIQNKQLGINCINGAITSMLDKKGIYAIEDDSITAWKMYNGVTEELKKASVLSESSKVLLLEDLFVSKSN